MFREYRAKSACLEIISLVSLMFFFYKPFVEQIAAVFDTAHAMSDRTCLGTIKRGNKMCRESNLAVFAARRVLSFIYWFLKFGGVLELLIF